MAASVSPAIEGSCEGENIWIDEFSWFLAASACISNLLVSAILRVCWANEKGEVAVSSGKTCCGNGA